MKEISQQELFDMMINEYEFDPYHNQEDQLYSHLCEVKAAYDRLQKENERLKLVLEECKNQRNMLTDFVNGFDISIMDAELDKLISGETERVG